MLTVTQIATLNATTHISALLGCLASFTAILAQLALPASHLSLPPPLRRPLLLLSFAHLFSAGIKIIGPFAVKSEGNGMMGVCIAQGVILQWVELVAVIWEAFLAIGMWVVVHRWYVRKYQGRRRKTVTSWYDTWWVWELDVAEEDQYDEKKKRQQRRLRRRWHRPGVGDLVLYLSILLTGMLALALLPFNVYGSSLNWCWISRARPWAQIACLHLPVLIVFCLCMYIMSRTLQLARQARKEHMASDRDVADTMAVALMFMIIYILQWGPGVLFRLIRLGVEPMDLTGPVEPTVYAYLVTRSALVPLRGLFHLILYMWIAVSWSRRWREAERAKAERRAWNAEWRPDGVDEDDAEEEGDGGGLLSVLSRKSRRKENVEKKQRSWKTKRGSLARTTTLGASTEVDVMGPHWGTTWSVDHDFWESQDVSGIESERTRSVSVEHPSRAQRPFEWLRQTSIAEMESHQHAAEHATAQAENRNAQQPRKKSEYLTAPSPLLPPTTLPTPPPPISILSPPGVPQPRRSSSLTNRAAVMAAVASSHKRTVSAPTNQLSSRQQHRFPSSSSIHSGLNPVPEDTVIPTAPNAAVASDRPRRRTESDEYIVW